MNYKHGFDHTFGHQDGKSQEMQVNQGFRQAFVIPRQPAKTRCPTKTALDYPAAGLAGALIYMSSPVNVVVA